MLRIATWNLERPSPRSRKNPLREELLRSLDADIVILTETTRALTLAPEYGSAFTQPSPRKPREDEAVAGVLYRRARFSLVDRIPTADRREAVCLRLETSGKERILVYGSIIPYHGYKGEDGRSAQWQEHKSAIAWHQEDWVRLRRDFPDDHLVTGGDYNQARDGVGRYGTIEVRDLLTEALEAADLSLVTDEPYKETRGLSRHCIDHICLSEGLTERVSGTEVWEGTPDGVRLSDHNGVFVDVGL